MGGPILIIQTSSIGPVLSICKVYTEHIMEFFVMRNEINKILLSFWISFMNLQWRTQEILPIRG